MYLFIWIDGKTRQVTDNLTIGDIMGVACGTLKILRMSPEGNSFEMLVKDEQRMLWVPVPEAKKILSSEVGFHIT